MDQEWRQAQNDDSSEGKAQFKQTLEEAVPASPPSPSSQPVSLTFTGKGIKRVKPKRTTSFFSRQLSSSQGSYTVVQPTDDSLEQS